MKISEGAGKLDTALSLFDRAYALAPVILGAAGVSAVSGWAASVSQSVAHIGPLAWVGAALVGALLFLLLYLLWQRGRLYAAQLMHARVVAERTNAINPLETVFTKVRVRIDDLKMPFIQPVVGKTFVDCELIGPAVILFSGNTNIDGTGFIGCDFVAVKDTATVQNVLPLINTTIRGGKIYQATILVPQSAINSIPKNAQWITV